jgi:hypothetical protein
MDSNKIKFSDEDYVVFLHGGLGNQLFQYHGVRKYYPEDTILFIGFNSLEKLYNCKNVIFFNNKFFRHPIFQQ